MTRLKYSLLLPLIATLISCTATGPETQASNSGARMCLLCVKRCWLSSTDSSLIPECRSTALQVTPYSPTPTSI